MAKAAQIPLVNEHLPLLRGALILRGHLWGPFAGFPAGCDVRWTPNVGQPGPLLKV